MQMSMVPMNMTYAGALANYRNVVNQRFPQESITKETNGRIQSTGTCGRGGSGRGRGPQGQTSGRGGSGRRNDDWDVTGIDSRTIHVHPAYQFDNEQWFNIPKDTRRQLVQCEVTTGTASGQGTVIPPHTKAKGTNNRTMPHSINFHKLAPTTQWFQGLYTSYRLIHR